MSDPYSAPGPETSEQRTSGKAIASLLLGLMSCVFGLFTGIPSVILGIVGLTQVNRSGGRLSGQGLAITGIVLGGIGIPWTCVLVGLFLPAVFVAKMASERISSQNNMKQIGMALQFYADRERHFPMAAGGEEGKPKHSWRVDILPYLEQAALHGRYQFDEAWDSASNQQLIGLMPEVFKAPGASGDKPGTTNIVAIVGDETIWPPDKATSFRDIQDGKSRTIMLIEVANTGISWTEPRDISFDEFVKGINEPGGPKSIYPGGIVILYADGSTRFLDSDTAKDTLRAMATRAGKDPVVLP